MAEFQQALSTAVPYTNDKLALYASQAKLQQKRAKSEEIVQYLLSRNLASIERLHPYQVAASSANRFGN
eukprot:6265623-Pyramimonas_sp.AAC.1